MGFSQTCTLAPKVDFGSGRAQIGGPNSNVRYILNATVDPECPTNSYYSILSHFSGNCFVRPGVLAPWYNITEDHTPGDTNGYMLLVNSPYPDKEFFKQRFFLCPFTTYKFKAYAMTLKKDGTGIEPDLKFTIKGSDGTVLESVVKILEKKETATWEEISFSFDTDNYSEVDLLIQDRTIENPTIDFGNDFVIDDISFTPSGYTAPEDFVIPSAFSPNGDGINDTWRITGLNTSFPNAHIQLFNRFGSLVFENKGSFISWDGSNGGKPLPIGTYYYIINFNSTVRRSGYVLIAK